VAEARATVEAKRAAVAAMTADVAGAQSTQRQNAREMERMRTLLQGGFVSQRDFDQAEMSAGTASATLEATRRRLSQAEKEVQQAEAAIASRVLAVSQARQRINEARAALGRVESQRRQVAVKEAEIERAAAALSQAQADLAFAELQLQHTEVRAPAAGVIAKKSVEVGQVVQMGQPLLAIVPLHECRCSPAQGNPARAREAGHARRGRDRYLPRPDLPRHGGLAERGHRARFCCCRPENATGNWVKVVQRVPVKIRLDAKEFGNPHTLRAGMSAYVVIRVK
jgi:membrane fusion protein (multidrug efflux system)